MADPFRFFHAEVVRTERLSPSLVRVTFGGPGLAGFASGGRDQSLSVFLPHPGQAEPVMPTGENWFAEYRALDPSVRAILRSYTVRAQRGAAGGGVEVDIDFVLHAEPAGPAATWAAGAGPGDRLILLGPAVPENTGVRFQLPEGASEVLLAADETALPAAAAILESLPDDLPVPVRAWLAVPDEGDRLPLKAPSGAEVTWITGGGQGRQDALVAAFREAAAPGGAPYAWLAGEAGMVKALRRHLVNECGVDRRSVSFIGYWRRGASEDDLRADAESAA